MSDRYGILMDAEEKRTIIDSALLYFDLHEDSRPNMNQVEKVLGYDRDTVRKHREGAIDVLPLDLADTIFTILENASPLINLQNPDRYIQASEEKYAREGMFDVEDRSQEWIFKRLSYSEFKDLTDKSRTSFNRHRQAKNKRVDYKIFEEAAQIVEEKMTAELPNCELVDRKYYQATGGEVEKSKPEKETIADVIEKYPWLEETESQEIPLHLRFREMFIDDGEPFILKEEQRVQ